MMTHVIIYNGAIIRSSDAPFVDKEYGASTPVDYDVVWQNGGLYKAGEEPSLTETMFVLLRAKRDERLADTDKFLLVDYPINENDLSLIKAYRNVLRSLPEQSGAPWDGGNDETPWPAIPDIMRMKDSV